MKFLPQINLKHVLQFFSYIAVAAIACVLTLHFFVPEKDPAMEAKLYELQNLINTYYIDEVDTQALYDGAAAGMVAGTGDRWSYYMTADEYENYQRTMASAYVGIGITIQETPEGYLEITKVDEGGGAYDAGLQVGDLILSAAGTSVQGLGASGAGKLIRGEEGTYVPITIRRGIQTLNLAVQRRLIEVVVATGTLLDNGIGLVHITGFEDRCYQETVAAIEQLRSQGATALIFDMRFNPGGYKSQLIKLLDYLLPEGPLFRSEYFDGTVQVEESDADFLDMPMAVLVNSDTYSAAEFFAAALQEYDAAIVVGTPTVGKGNMQDTFELSDGSAVNLSVGHYCTPSGVSLANVGVTPDIEVSVSQQIDLQIYRGTLSPADDPQIQAAIEALTA